MARRTPRQFPRSFQGDPRAFRLAYEEVFEGFIRLTEVELGIVADNLERILEEHAGPRRERQRLQGRLAAAREAILVLKHRELSDDQLEKLIKALRASDSQAPECRVAIWVSRKRNRVNDGRQ